MSAVRKQTHSIPVCWLLRVALLYSILGTKYKNLGPSAVREDHHKLHTSWMGALSNLQVPV